MNRGAMEYSYHGVAVANPGNQLLEEEASLNNEHTQEFRVSIDTSTQEHAKNWHSRYCQASSQIRGGTGTSSLLNRPALQMRLKSSPPEAYSMTIAR